MKYNSKRFLALLLSLSMAFVPATGTLAESVNPDILVGAVEKTTEAAAAPVAEKKTEKTAEKLTEKPEETVAEKVTEKQEETAAEKVTEKTTEKAEETVNEKVTEKEEEVIEQEVENQEKTETEESETQSDNNETVSETDTEQSETGIETEETSTEQSETDAQTEEGSSIPSESESETETETTQTDSEAEEVLNVKETETEKTQILAAEGEDGDEKQEIESPNAPEQFTQPVDNSTELADGVYKPDTFTFSKADGKTSKTTISCNKITVTGGKAYATVVIGSNAYSYVKASGNKYTGVCDENTSTFTIPIELGKDNIIIGHTTKMQSEIAYYICAIINEENIGDTDESKKETESSKTEELFTTEVDNTTALDDGTYTPDNFTFSKADGKTSKTSIICNKVVVKEGKSYATITIGSSAYKYVKASGKKYTGVNDEQADTSTFTIPIKLGENNKIVGYTTKMMTEIAYFVCAEVKEIESPHETDASTDAVDNTTSLVDNMYTPDSVSFSKADGGTSKTSITCTNVTVRNGKAYATIMIGSSAYSYVKASGKKYTGVNDEIANTSTFTIPIKLGENNKIIGYTTKMSKEIEYLLCIKINEKENSEDDTTTPVVDNSTTLADGSYIPDSFTFSKADGGTSKTTISCSSVTVTNGKAYATIVIGSNAYSYVKASGDKYTGTNDDTTSTFTIPIQLGVNNTIIGYTTKMSKEISYMICAIVSGTAQKPDEDPGNGKDNPGNSDHTGPVKLQNGNYNVPVDSSQNSMFRVVDCVMNYKDGKMTARVALSGTGYDKLYMGSAANAPSDEENWIKAVDMVINSEGKEAFRFDIPVAALDTEIHLASYAVKSGKWSDRVLIFLSEGMTLINADGDDTTTETESEKETGKETEKETEKENDKTADKESHYESDTSGSTSRVDSSTGLADGVYTPDKFSWSGGSGRTSISCTKVTVSGGQAYATIVFSSSNYGYVKANGNKYYPSYGAGTSIFTIPVNLNANNTIIGMTTAMSAAHEITYTIYVYIAGADDAAASKDKELNKDGLSEEIPEIVGLTYSDEAEIDHAEYFKIYYYDQGITMIEVDMAADTDKPEETEAETKDAVTLTSELYQENVVRYLVVPETAEIPVGLEKEMIVIQVPVDSVYTDSEQALGMMEKLELEELVTVEGETAKKPEYKELILNKCNLAVLSDEFLWDEEKEELTIEEQSELLYEITERLTTLEIPAIVDRSADERTEEAAAEWIKVYGVLFGCAEAAEALYQETMENMDEK